MKILAIDDEEANLGILKINLERKGYEVVTADNGHAGLQLLAQNAKEIDIILLDRMMPGMDGMEFLGLLKKTKAFERIPVIMQTAAATTNQIIQGIEAGVFYYLVKPFDSRTLLSIVNSAAREVEYIKQMDHDIEKMFIISDIICKCEFRIKSPQEARRLGIYMGNLCKIPNHISIGYGISELLLNSIEHGNLGIGYKLKNELLNNSVEEFKQEVDRRLELPENKTKYVDLTYNKTPSSIEIVITDQGEGFNYDKYMDFDPDYFHEPNGRGVPLAKIHCKNMKYNQKGNSVKIIVEERLPAF